MNLMCFLGARMENQAAYHPHFRMDLASGPTCRRAIKRAAGKKERGREDDE